MAPASSKCSARLSNSIWKRLGQGKIISEVKERAVVFLLPPKQSDPLPSLSRTFSWCALSFFLTMWVQRGQLGSSSSGGCNLLSLHRVGISGASNKGSGERSTGWEKQMTHYTPCTHYNCCTTAVTGLLGSPRSAPSANSWLISREHPSIGQVLKQSFAITWRFHRAHIAPFLCTKGLVPISAVQHHTHKHLRAEKQHMGTGIMRLRRQ